MPHRLYLPAILLLVSLVTSLSYAAEGDQPREDYRLGAGDKLSISVLNQDDLTGQYTINGAGRFVMPYIDSIPAEGLNIQELTDTIVDKLKPDYLVNPQISIEVLNFRPFYIIGEVETPNSYPYIEGMTYLNAVAIAGGFSYRAKKKYVLVKRKDDPTGTEIKLKLEQLVLPGDIIRVAERLF